MQEPDHIPIASNSLGRDSEILRRECIQEPIQNKPTKGHAVMCVLFYLNKIIMVYLYFDQLAKVLYAYDEMSHVGKDDRHDIKWDNIETVTADKDRGQICAHKMGTGIVAEFPIGRTMLTCQKPVN
jgi:hypothetical protein